MQTRARTSERSGLKRFVQFILGEVFLGFLALVAAALALIPLLFQTSPHTDALLEAGQWSIIVLFAVEYGSGLAAAPNKWAFVINRWRLIDAATILIPMATLLPGATDLLRSTPVLRLVRLARVVSLGVRASGVMVREEKAAVAAQALVPLQVRMLRSDEAATSRQATWEEFVRWAKQPGTEWYSIAHVGQHNLSALASATGIAPDFIASHLLGASYPRLDSAGRYLALFVWLPEIGARGPTERNGLLLLASDTSVITVSRRPAPLLEKITQMQKDALASHSFPVRMVCQFLELVLDANETLVGQFEQQLRDLEDLPVRDSRQEFFEQTFRLKKELSAAQSDLWRLRGAIKELAEGRTKLPGDGKGVMPFLGELAETADYLYETVNNIREGVLSLIELHLNVVSFEMNRVMRVLAVVSVLGLIPAVIGGLFGMNLADNPWPFTLPQVTFAVGMAMVTCLYFFVVKGWLR